LAAVSVPPSKREALTDPDGLVMKPINGKTRIVTKQKSAGAK